VFVWTISLFVDAVNAYRSSRNRAVTLTRFARISDLQQTFNATERLRRRAEVNDST